jgi:hypothetical protein
MRLLRTPIYALLTIATIASTQTLALSQDSFKVPTHPTASEVGAIKVQPAEMPMAKALASKSQLGDRQNFFAHPPTLIRANALHQSAYAPSIYEFTITVPADAGAALKAVSVMQDRNVETIRFEHQSNKAFVGNRYAAGPEIPLASVGGVDAAPGTTTVVFEQPVQPGTTVTVAIDAKANPGFGGIYEFGVTAYPEGDQVKSQFLGYGRIAFNGAGD